MEIDLLTEGVSNSATTGGHTALFSGHGQYPQHDQQHRFPSGTSHMVSRILFRFQRSLLSLQFGCFGVLRLRRINAEEI